jgi:hypothetical protein
MSLQGSRAAGDAAPGGVGATASRPAAPPEASLLNLLLFAAPRAAVGETLESRQSRALSVPALADAVFAASAVAGGRQPPLRAIAMACAVSAERFEVNGEARFLVRGAWSWA